VLCVNLTVFVMTTKDPPPRDEDTEFDIKAWYVNSRISASGLKKLLLHEVKDVQSLLLMSPSDVASMKLAAADKAKFVNAVDAIRPKKIPSLEGDSPGVEDKSKPENQGGENLGNQGGDVVVNGNIPEQASQFSLADVAGFLAGRPIPENLSQTIVN
jgi:hypothetical protein